MLASSREPPIMRGFSYPLSQRKRRASPVFSFGAERGIRTPGNSRFNGFQEIDGISHFVPNTP